MSAADDRTAVLGEIRGRIKACWKTADDLILWYAVKDRVPLWQMGLIKAYWAVRGGTSERQLALRWLPSRYRLMVADVGTGAGAEWIEWVRCINGKRIPIFTHREGERRRADFMRTHPECITRLERCRG